MIIVFQILLVFCPINLFPYIQYAYFIFMYLTISILICIEIRNLEDFHIEKFTLFIFIVSSLWRRRLGIDGEIFFLVIIGLIGIFTAIIVFKHRSRISRTSLRWAVAGILVGAISFLPMKIIDSLHFSLIQLPPGQRILDMFPLPLAIVRQIIYFLSVGVAIEELLFRGFLWGYLHRLGWTEKRVFWVQAGLFWGMHLAQLITPLNFFLAVPIAILAYSVLTLRSKQVFPSLLSHLTINTLLSLF
jgi:membrane protease YdiL (CAAX protease family)